MSAWNGILFDSQNNIRDKIEDESIAVLLLIAASGSLNSKIWREFRPWFLARFGVPTREKLVKALPALILFGPEVAGLFVSIPTRPAQSIFCCSIFRTNSPSTWCAHRRLAHRQPRDSTESSTHPRRKVRETRC